jgi:anti-anti-sigma factor
LLQHQETLIDGPLTVGMDRYGQGLVVVSLGGELDRSNVESARQAITEVTTGEADEILVIDLSPLEFIDSGGIELLVWLAAADGEEHALRIVPSDAPAVSRIMSLTGVDAMIQVARQRPRQAV